MSNLDPLPLFRGLYYPSCRIDRNFAKVLCLYWDKIYRVVPAGLQCDDNEDIFPLLESGFISDVDPAPFRSTASESFTRFLESKAGRRMRERGTDGCGYLSRLKIDYKLEQLLLSEGFVTIDGNRLKVTHGLVRFYIFYLASCISKDRKLCPITDDVSFWAALHYFHEQVEQTPFTRPVNETANTAYFAGLFLRQVTPVLLNHVSSEDLLVFREKRTAERRRYMGTFQEVCSKLSSVETCEDALDYLRTYERDMLGATEDFRKSLRDLRIETILSIRVISIPVAAHVFNSLLNTGNAFLWISDALGLALGGFAAFHEYRKRRRLLTKQCDYSYLHLIADNLAHHSYTKTINVRDFTFSFKGWAGNVLADQTYPLNRILSRGLSEFMYD